MAASRSFDFSSAMWHLGEDSGNSACRPGTLRAVQCITSCIGSHLPSPEAGGKELYHRAKKKQRQAVVALSLQLPPQHPIVLANSRTSCERGRRWWGVFLGLYPEAGRKSKECGVNLAA